MASGKRKKIISELFGISKEVKTMADWKCQKCGYTLKDEKPPEECPSCKEKCEFADVSCYTPDCGNTGTDNRL
jgi:rubrerythrin